MSQWLLAFHLVDPNRSFIFLWLENIRSKIFINFRSFLGMNKACMLGGDYLGNGNIGKQLDSSSLHMMNWNWLNWETMILKFLLSRHLYLRVPTLVRTVQALSSPLMTVDKTATFNIRRFSFEQFNTNRVGVLSSTSLLQVIQDLCRVTSTVAQVIQRNKRFIVFLFLTKNWLKYVLEFDMIVNLY